MMSATERVLTIYELAATIVRNVDRASLTNLACVNKQWFEFMIPFIWGTLRNEKYLLPDLYLLYKLCDWNRFQVYARHLVGLRIGIRPCMRLEEKSVNELLKCVDRLRTIHLVQDSTSQHKRFHEDINENPFDNPKVERHGSRDWVSMDSGNVIAVDPSSHTYEEELSTDFDGHEYQLYKIDLARQLSRLRAKIDTIVVDGSTDSLEVIKFAIKMGMPTDNMELVTWRLPKRDTQSYFRFIETAMTEARFTRFRADFVYDSFTPDVLELGIEDGPSFSKIISSLSKSTTVKDVTFILPGEGCNRWNTISPFDSSRCEQNTTLTNFRIVRSYGNYINYLNPFHGLTTLTLQYGERDEELQPAVIGPFDNLTEIYVETIDHALLEEDDLDKLVMNSPYLRMVSITVWSQHDTPLSFSVSEVLYQLDYNKSPQLNHLCLELGRGLETIHFTSLDKIGSACRQLEALDFTFITRTNHKLRTFKEAKYPGPTMIMVPITDKEVVQLNERSTPLFPRLKRFGPCILLRAPTCIYRSIAHHFPRVEENICHHCFYKQEKDISQWHDDSGLIEVYKKINYHLIPNLRVYEK